MNEGLSADIRKYVSVTAILIGAVICLVCLIFVKDKIGMLIGVPVGTAVAILNFNIMALAGEKAIDMTPSKARTKMTTNYIIRYAIYIVVLVAAIKLPLISPIGVVLGFLTSIVALYLIQVLNKPGVREKFKFLNR